MRKRMGCAVMLLCPMLVGLAIAPGRGQMPATMGQRTPGQASAAPSRQITARASSSISDGLRYFRFQANRCRPATSAISGMPWGRVGRVLSFGRRGSGLDHPSDPAMSIYRYIWVDDRGNTFHTNNPKQNPNNDSRRKWQRHNAQAP